MLDQSDILYGTTGQVDKGRAEDVVYLDFYFEGDKALECLLLWRYLKLAWASPLKPALGELALASDPTVVPSNSNHSAIL